MTNDLYKGTSSVAGPQNKRPGRKYEIQAKDFTSVEQAAPVRVVYGRFEAAATQITPIFDFRSEAIRTKAGK